MVYHAPGTEPLGNSWWLGPIRILTSDERSAQILRAPFVYLGKAAFAAYGLAKLLELGFPAIEQQAPKVATFMSEYKGPKGGFVEPVFVALGVMLFGKATYYLVSKWNQHVRPVPPISATFFHTTDKEGNPPPGIVGGVMFNVPKKTWYAWPVLTIDQGLLRAFNYTGMKFLSFLKTELTVGVEYPLTAAYRQILHYFNVPKYNNFATRSNLYEGVLNTSFACFICADDKNPDFGNVVMTDVVLPYATDGTKFFTKLMFVLDHQKREFVKAVCTWVRTDKSLQTEVWGSPNPEENTDPAYRNQPEVQLEQAALIMIVTVSLYSHAIVHWWANGAALVEKKMWPVQMGSTNITNWMNTQAIYLSWLFMGDQMSAIEGILVRNNANGLPLHGHNGETKFQMMIGDRSTFHKMGGATRTALLKYFKDKLPADQLEHNLQTIDAIMAATVWHNAEHYYANKFFPLFGPANVVILKTDVSGLIRSLIAPIKYKLARLLLKDYKDPVSQMIYEICNGIDRDFANNALSIGCAF